MGRIHHRAAAAALILLLAGCGRNETPQDDPAATGTAASTIATTSTTVQSAALPQCADITTIARYNETHPDCRMDFRDGSGWSFIARYTQGDNGATQSIEVIDNTGRTRQTLVERDLYTQYSPRLDDLDGDGRDEVVIPRDLAANGNVTYAIYRWATTEFVHAGELNGYGPERTPSGYIGIAAKDTYLYWQIGFWTFENNQLREAVHVEIESHPHDTGPGGTSTCRVTDASGLPASGLTDTEIQQRFCAEPLVQWAKPFN